MKFNIVTSSTLAALALMPATASAYIDPGTGSILIQGLIGAIAAIGVTLKLYWHRVVKFFRRGPQQEGPEAEKSGDQQSSDVE